MYAITQPELCYQFYNLFNSVLFIYMHCTNKQSLMLYYHSLTSKRILKFLVFFFFYEFRGLHSCYPLHAWQAYHARITEWHKLFGCNMNNGTATSILLMSVERTVTNSTI